MQVHGISVLTAAPGSDPSAFSLKCVPVAAVEWVYLLLWLPVAGLLAAGIVAWRWGWQTLALSSLAWAALAFVLFGPVLPGSSAAAGARIALFVYFIPWLFGGSLVLLIRERRRGHRSGK